MRLKKLTLLMCSGTFCYLVFSVVDPHHFDADPDADPDLNYHPDVNPDAGPDADPGPDF
jgi:hypothetical protein